MEISLSYTIFAQNFSNFDFFEAQSPIITWNMALTLSLDRVQLCKQVWQGFRPSNTPQGQKYVILSISHAFLGPTGLLFTIPWGTSQYFGKSPQKLF